MSHDGTKERKNIYFRCTQALLELLDCHLMALGLIVDANINHTHWIRNGTNSL